MKKWNLIRAVTIICMVFLILSLAAPALAVVTEEIEAKQQELEEIEKRRRDQKNALELRLNREAALKEELKHLEFRIEELRLEQEKLAVEIAAVENEIEQAEADLAAAEAQLKSQEDLLKLRLRAIQQHGVVSYLEVLFESSSFPDFLTRLHSLSTIANNDMDLIEQIKRERDIIQAWKEELEQKKAKLENMRRQVVENEQALESAAGERVVILESLEVEIAANLKAINDLEKEAQQLDALIRKLIAEAASKFSGLQGALQVTPFDFLKRVDPTHLMNFIQNEHPQTIALILAHLEFNSAAEIMGALSPELQSEVSMRIATMDQTSPEIISEVERVLERKLATVLSQEFTAAGGIEALAELLNRCDRTTEKTILEALEEENQELADEIKKLMFVFDDIISLAFRCADIKKECRSQMQ